MNLKQLFRKAGNKPYISLQQAIYHISDGVSIDAARNLVEYLDEPADEQSLVDLSIENNPYPPEILKVKLTNGEIVEATVYSIFRRYEDNNGEFTDANPLIYAMKNINGWHFKKDGREKIMKLMNEIAKKIKNEIGKDITIMLPSSSELNKTFAKSLQNIVPQTKIFTEMISKRNAMDVYREIVEGDINEFKKYFKNNINEKLRELKGYCEKMAKRHKGMFSYHEIPTGTKMRDLIMNSLKYEDIDMYEYSKAINNKNILIIDDSLYHGNTVKNAIKMIGDTFSPKSYTVLTMFSKSYDQ